MEVSNWKAVLTIGEFQDKVRATDGSEAQGIQSHGFGLGDDLARLDGGGGNHHSVMRLAKQDGIGS